MLKRIFFLKEKKKRKVSWKIVELARSSVIYIYIDENWNRFWWEMYTPKSENAYKRPNRIYLYTLYTLADSPSHWTFSLPLSLSLMDSQMLDFFLKPGLCVSFSLYIAKFHIRLLSLKMIHMVYSHAEKWL